MTQQDYQLPTLYGSEKAVKWAEDLRFEHLGNVFSLIDRYVTDDYQQFLVIEHFALVLERYVSAHWWVDNRENDITAHLWTTLRSCIRARNRRMQQPDFTPKLIVFTCNNVLTNTPFVDGKDRFILPGRKEILKPHYDRGGFTAIAENDGGVAFGKRTEEEAWDDYMTAAKELNIDVVRLCFGHPGPGREYLEEYGYDEVLKRRKPAPAMILEILEELGVSPADSIYVGKFPEDRQAALNAKLRDYIDAGEFFQEITLPEPPAIF